MSTKAIRPEKLALAKEYRQRLEKSPYMILVDYHGLNVASFTQLRNRLLEAGAEIHVVRNRIFQRVASEFGLEAFKAPLKGQTAVITGIGDFAAAAKALKTFAEEVGRPQVKFGFIGRQLLTKEDIEQIALLPPLKELRAKIAGTIVAPASQLARVIREPAAALARVIKARAEKS